MNRFIIEETPKLCAQSHCDKHVPKMVVEEAQMLCAAHRLLDGTLTQVPAFDKQGNPVFLKSGQRRTKKHWVLPDDREDVLYKAAHTGHPCTVWSMKTRGNYMWAVNLFVELCNEYTHRYSKTHKSASLIPWIMIPPTNIDPSEELTKMPLAMGIAPECIDHNDIIGSYRKFYQTKQQRFKMVWTNRKKPEWFAINNTDLGRLKTQL